MSSRLRAAVAASVTEASVRLIAEREPRVQIEWEPRLLAPKRNAGDVSGDPEFRRSARQQEQLVELLRSADAVLGVPDGSSAALKRLVCFRRSAQP